VIDGDYWRQMPATVDHIWKRVPSREQPALNESLDGPRQLAYA
jgi:hypothetical protein